MPRKASGSVQSRSWVFTDFNLERLKLFWPTVVCKKLWIGLEKAPSTGKEHLQGFVLWLRPYRESQLKKLVPGAHWEAAQMVDAENYSLKEDLVLRREMTDSEESKIRAERQWTSKDFRDACIRDIKDGICNRCLMEAYPGFLFSQSSKVFLWRYMGRYGCEPPWRKEEWCQQCGEHLGQVFQGRDHACMTCTKCGIKAEPPQYKRPRHE